MDTLDSFLHGEPSFLQRNASEALDLLSRELYRPRLDILEAEYLEATKTSLPYNLSHEKIIARLSSLGVKRVCQYQFKKNDIVWICRQCESDETCVQCNDCFQDSNHQGHEVYFYHSATGGCCDCGDPGAWKPQGFCSRHGRSCEDPLHGFPSDLHESAQGVISKVIHAIVKFWEDFHTSCVDIQARSMADAIDIVVINDDVHTFDDISRAFVGHAIIDVKQTIQSIHDRGHGIILTQTVSWASDVLSRLRGKGILVAGLSSTWRTIAIAMQESIHWLTKLAATSDAMCRIITDCFNVDYLERVCQVDNYIPKAFILPLHNLFLAMMADNQFKQHLSICYAKCYERIAGNYARGIGTSDCNLFSLSVQFLNRDFYVTKMMESYDFLRVLSRSLLSCLESPSTIADALVKSTVTSAMLLGKRSVAFRRYNPIVSDLKIVFALPGMTRCFLSQCLEQFLALLITYQGMHPQVRQLDQHVLYEDTLWTNAFNFHINLSSIFDSLFAWFQDPLSCNSTEYVYSNPSISRTFPLISVGDVLNQIIGSIYSWHSSRLDDQVMDSSSLIFLESMSESSIRVCIPLIKPLNSFHLILHRFYADALRELFLYPHHVETIRSHLLNPVLRLSLHAFAIDPIEVLSFASDINAGLWVKNGRSMFDQLLNYQDPPFSRLFRSLDIMFIQIMMMAAISHQEPLLLVPLLYKYLGGVDGKAHCLETLFLILIHLLQELPSLPTDNAQERVIPQIRRALVHRLAQGSCTYSQLNEGCSHIPSYTKINPHVIDELVNELADKREDLAHRLEPTKYSLKRVFWKEYDPCYAYVNDRGHNLADDNRPKLSPSSIEPMVNPRPLASYHVLARPLYTAICVDLDLWMIIRTSLRHYFYDMEEELQVIMTLPKDESLLAEEIKLRVEDLRKRWQISYLAMQRAVQMFTIIVFYLLEDVSSSNHVFEFLINDEETVIDSGSQKSFSRPSLWKVLVHSTSGTGTGSSNASTSMGTNTDEYRLYLKWIMENLQKHPNAPREIVDYSEVSASNDTAMDISSPDKTKAQKMQRARERALKKLQKSAEKFKASSTATTSPGKEDEPVVGDEESHAPTSAQAGDAAVVAVEEELVCMTCRSPGTELDMLTYLAYRQQSRVAHPRPCSQTLKMDHHISFCGHMIHVSCYNSHFASVVARTENQYGLLLYDPFIGQSPCPLCKRICNRLVPIYPSNASKASQAMDIDSKPKPWIVRWMQWCHLKGIDLENWLHSYPAIASLASLKDFPMPTTPSPPSSIMTSTRLFSRFFRPSFMSLTSTTMTMTSPSRVTSIVEPLTSVRSPPKESNASSGAAVKFLDDFGSQMGVASIPSSISMQLQSVCQSIAYTISCQEMAMNMSEGNKENHTIKPIDRKGLQYMLLAAAHGIEEVGEVDVKGSHIHMRSYLKRMISNAFLGRCSSFDWNLSEPGLYLLMEGSPLLLKSLYTIFILILIINTAEKEISGEEIGDVEYLIECLSIAQAFQYELLAYLWPNTEVVVEGTETSWENYIQSQEIPASTMEIFELILNERMITSVSYRVQLFKAWQSFHRSLRYVAWIFGYEIDISNLEYHLPVNEAKVLLSLWRDDLRMFHGDILAHRDFLRHLAYPSSQHEVYSIHHHSPSLYLLPSSYTNLHAHLSQQYGYEQPAVCLTCGFVLDTKERGVCQAHSTSCSGETGLFFLIQDASILLLHGPRTCYVPGPYADESGEHPRTFRGRPLTLDHRRMNILTKMWLEHEIVREVMLKRSTSQRVIILGHY